MIDAFRLAFGTLTIIRVRPPRRVDAEVARHAMLLAPLAGLALGLIAELVVLGVRWAVPGSTGLILVAATGIATLAVLTRGLHLDGLADTADGLASGRTGGAAVDVMKRSDVGPFGVVTLVLVLLLQVGALYAALALGRGTLALVGGAVVARLAIAFACRRGVPPARSQGLGADVANTVPAIALLAVTMAVALFLVIVVQLDHDLPWTFGVNAIAGLLAALAASQLLMRRCVRRFGGVTGDVLGAVCEVGFLAYLLVIASG